MEKTFGVGGCDRECFNARNTTTVRLVETAGKKKKKNLNTLPGDKGNDPCNRKMKNACPPAVSTKGVREEIQSGSEKGQHREWLSSVSDHSTEGHCAKKEKRREVLTPRFNFLK